MSNQLPVVMTYDKGVFKEILAEFFQKMDELIRRPINMIFDFIRNLLFAIDNQLFYNFCVSVFLVYIFISFVVLTTWSVFIWENSKQKIRFKVFDTSIQIRIIYGELGLRS
ncbi:hypothetical protein Avbf_14698 [Armadillidium vulgare]|nr:hypothetical protein Avbf_14698 [Armadillidium vulgare]